MKEKDFRSWKKREEGRRVRRREIVKEITGGYERLFAETKNPLYAWKVWEIYRKTQFMVPEWVQVYLDESAAKLMAHAFGGLSIEVPRAVANALGFTGKAKGFSAYSDFEKMMPLINNYIESRKRGCSKSVAYEEVSDRFGMDGRTVKARVSLFCTAIGCELHEYERGKGVALKVRSSTK